LTGAVLACPIHDFMDGSERDGRPDGSTDHRAFNSRPH
jgi:hypothetical protein